MPMYKGRLCRCWDNGLKENWNWDQLCQFVSDRKQCNDPIALCPTVDRLLRDAEKQKMQREQYEKYMRSKGKEPGKGRAPRGPKIREAVELDF